MILRIAAKAVQIWMTASLIACTIMLIFAGVYLQNPLFFLVSTALSVESGSSFYHTLTEFWEN